MTAVNIAIQKRAVHIMTDGLSYNKEGLVVEVSPKCWALPSLNAAVACMGPSLANIITAAEFTKRFSSFDEMIAGLEEAMPKIYIANLSLLTENGGGIPDTRIYIGGWSEGRNRPEAYSILCIPPDSLQYWYKTHEKQKAEFGEKSVVADEPFKLVPLDDVIMNPPFAAGLTGEQCGFKASKATMADTLDPEVDMVVMLQMQRLREEPLRPGLPATSKVGGHALLTSIDAGGIRQRVVHRWPADKIGEVIAPEHNTDWKAFRRELKGRRRWWK
ncbi:hypothetical protein [Bradyrhizobium sp. 187]|uniref:hypothetical protein n=1 Tax=Bradyrhizobium sp. 187 TaxID=2782655 RepID=UPI00200032BE|nr:hypothetical protein [Bradyrhizobium sp. 187]UPJ69862.1 hypothetical protein IVB19_19165 [Bradyrhizobium sp. 187]